MSRSHHPLVRQLIDIHNASGRSQLDLAVSSGYAAITIRKMREGNRRPWLDTFVDVANTLGYDVVLVKRETRKAG